MPVALADWAATSPATVSNGIRLSCGSSSSMRRTLAIRAGASSTKCCTAYARSQTSGFSGWRSTASSTKSATSSNLPRRWAIAMLAATGSIASGLSCIASSARFAASFSASSLSTAVRSVASAALSSASHGRYADVARAASTSAPARRPAPRGPAGARASSGGGTASTASGAPGGLAASTPRKMSSGIVTPGMSESQSNHIWIPHASDAHRSAPT